jgi:DNA-binding MarR family transcriptional regulator
VLRLTPEGRRLYEIMRPQTHAVADYLLSDLSEADLAKLDELVGKLIARLEATDEKGRSLFLERTKPPEEG